MKIGVIGVGYVGLVTAVCFARLGHQVIGADQSAEKIATLNSGGLPIFEPGLDKFLHTAQTQNQIRFTTNVAEAIEQSEVLFVAVGTPSSEYGQADLSHVWATADMIAKHGQSHQLVIIKSTVPVGTTDAIHQFLKKRSSISFLDVVHNPEFLRQGQAIQDFMHPDRIVAGTGNHLSPSVIREIYQSISAPIQFCDRKSAELIKYASNAFLALKISYINMFAQLSEKVGANIDEIAKGMGMDDRIGPAFLRAGIGYGGSCFPKDTQALLALGREIGLPLPLIEATDQINRQQPLRFVEQLEKYLGTLKGKKIALFGLSFKPMTDDFREAPSLIISQMLIKKGAVVHAYDPLVQKFPISPVHIHSDPYSTCDQADALMILTDWEEFRALHWSRIISLLHQPILLDGRNLFTYEEMEQLAQEIGFKYYSVGRPSLDSCLISHPILH